jgi:hypothetical protein
MEYIIALTLLASVIVIANNYYKRKSLREFDRKYRASRRK